jgi:hypothetical protein
LDQAPNAILEFHTKVKDGMKYHRLRPSMILEFKGQIRFCRDAMNGFSRKMRGRR